MNAPIFHPSMASAMAAEHIRDLKAQAAAARQAREARRGRRTRRHQSR